MVEITGRISAVSKADENGNPIADYEPLAANINGPGRTLKKRLFNKEITRLFATFIGCPFASLWDREKLREKNRSTREYIALQDKRLEREEQLPFSHFAEHDDLSGQPLPHGFRTEIRKIMQNCHFVIPKPEAVPEGLQKAREILDTLLNGGYAINQDFVEARSLATVACIVLQEVLDKQ